MTHGATPSSSKYRPNFPRNSKLICSPRSATIIDDGQRIGGERGIRTLEGLLTLTPLAGVRLRPLGHLSGGRNHNDPESGWQRTRSGACQAGRVSRGRALGSSEFERSVVPWPLLMRSKISSR